MPGADDPMEVVFSLFDARRRHSIEDVSALLDPDVVHEGVSDELHCTGREQVLRNVRHSFERADQGLSHLEMTAAGDECVVVGLAGSRFNDAPWAGDADHVYIVHTVRDGKVVLMRDFLDRVVAFREAGAEAGA